MKTAIELDGYTTHARSISSDKFDDHVERQNDLLFQGWFLLRLSSGMIIEKSEVCRRQLMQAIGHWHYIRIGGMTEQEAELWDFRRKRIARVAMRQNGSIRPIDAAKAFDISTHTASVWLRKLASEGFLVPVGGSRRVTAYQLRG